MPYAGTAERAPSSLLTASFYGSVQSLPRSGTGDPVERRHRRTETRNAMVDTGFARWCRAAATLAWPLDARVKGEFDPNPARLAHHEMDLRSLARELRCEFHDNARSAGNAFMQGVQSRSIGDGQGQMMKADIGAPVELNSSVRRLDPP